jgi:plastocyanin
VTPSTARVVLLAGGLFVATGIGCTDNGGNGNGNPGAAGSSGGTGGTTGSGGSGGASGGTGGTAPGFMSIAPCQNQSDYMPGTTVDFGLINGAFAYAPKCLSVSLPVAGGNAAGGDVTFNGDFSMHPLEPSALRGAQTGNPITATSAGSSATFHFSTAGFFAYFCQTHNPSDNGAAMSGVVWVTQQVLTP